MRRFTWFPKCVLLGENVLFVVVSVDLGTKDSVTMEDFLLTLT